MVQNKLFLLLGGFFGIPECALCFSKALFWLIECHTHTHLETEMAASISRLTKFRNAWAVPLIMIRKRKCSLFSQAHNSRHYDSGSHKSVMSENK